jgi:hypothetical protein
MYDPNYYSDGEQVKRDSERSGKINSELDKLFFDWAKLNEEVEKLGV